MTFAPGDGFFKFYGLADLQLELGSGWDHGWAFGPGGELGLELTEPADHFQGRLLARGRRFVAGDPETHVTAGVAGRVTLNARTALLAEAALNRFDGDSWIDGSLSLQWTF